MTIDAPAPSATRTRAANWGVGFASCGAIAALVLLIAYSRVVLMVPIDPHVQVVASYLVVWLPLAGVTLFAVFARGTGSPARDIGLRFTWLDLAWGVGLGVLMRAVSILIEFAVYGRAGGGIRLGEPAFDGWWLFAVVLAPILVAPLIEESYFRGLLQPALVRRSGSAAWGIGITSAVFALLHVATVTTVPAGLVLGCSTFLFGIAAGTLSRVTGRIGGAVIAHVTFNALAILLLV